MTPARRTAAPQTGLTVFVAHSFAVQDRAVVTSFVRTLRGLRVRVTTGAEPNARSLAAKIQAAIRAADVFVAVCTRRGNGSTSPGTSAWVIEEKGFSLGDNPRRPIVLLVEDGLDASSHTGGLGGDIEYIVFDRYELDSARARFKDVIAKLRPIKPRRGTNGA